MTGSTGNRVLDRLAAKFFLPLDLAGQEILADQPVPVAEAVNVAVNQDHAAVMIDLVVVVVHLFGGKFPVAAGELDEIAADAVAGGRINVMVVINGRRNAGD